MPTDRDPDDTDHHRPDQPEPTRPADRPTEQDQNRETINTQLERLTGDRDPNEETDNRRQLDQDLCIAGNASGFKVRPRDFPSYYLDDSTIVGPYRPESPLDDVEGLSAYDSVDNLTANASGVVWKVGEGTALPEGVSVLADGADVQQSYRQEHDIPKPEDQLDQPAGHRTVHPETALSYADFQLQLGELDKMRVGKADKGRFKPIEQTESADRPTK
jgi:hypothetical protein